MQQVGPKDQVEAGEQVRERGLVAGERQPGRLPVVAGGLDQRVRVGGGAGQQYAALLEGLAHGRAHHRSGQIRRAAKHLGPRIGRGTAPARRQVPVAGIDGAAGEDVHARGEVHR